MPMEWYGPVNALAKLDGGCLASGSTDTTVKIWSVATGACVATLEGHDDNVISLAELEKRKTQKR